MNVRLIGVPSSRGTTSGGARRTPARVREAGIVEWLTAAGLEVEDSGDVAVAVGGDAPRPAV